MIAVCADICSFISFDSLILTFLVRLVVCANIPNGIFFILFRKNVYFQALVAMVAQLAGGKFEFLEKLAK